VPFVLVPPQVVWMVFLACRLSFLLRLIFHLEGGDHLRPQPASSFDLVVISRNVKTPPFVFPYLLLSRFGPPWVPPRATLILLFFPVPPPCVPAFRWTTFAPFLLSFFLTEKAVLVYQRSTVLLSFPPTSAPWPFFHKEL